jgi:copper chaperone NosL
MRSIPVFALLVFASACASTSPVPIRAGDVCFHCRQTITDTKLAAEVISQSGHAFKFSSVGCLSDYLRDHPDEITRAVFVTDYNRGRLFPAQKAWFVKFEVNPAVKAEDYAAFRDKDDALAFAGTHHSELVEWEFVSGAQGHPAHPGH